MSLTARQWSGDFLFHAADTQTKTRTRFQQTKTGLREHSEDRLGIRYRSLPTRRSLQVKMSPVHLAVYRALIDHASDANEDVATSSASVNQLVLTCGYSPSTVNEKLSELEAVGFIRRKSRANNSSITTIFRAPLLGENAHVLPSPAVPLPASPEADVNDLSPASDASDSHTTLAQAIHKAIDGRFGMNAGDTDKATWENQLHNADTPDLHFPDNELEMVIFPTEYIFSAADTIQNMIPTTYRVVTVPKRGFLSILPTAEEVASRMLSRIVGSTVRFGRVPKACSRNDLPLIIWYALKRGTRVDLTSHLRAADDPAAYLSHALPDIIRRWDEEWAKDASTHPEESDSTDYLDDAEVECEDRF